MNNTNTDEDEILKNNPDNTEVDTTVDTDEDEEIDYKAEYEKTKAIAENQKIRAEKAEAKLKSSPADKGETYKKSNELSAFDLSAIVKADIDEDTLTEVMEYAKFKKISIADALKSPVIKATITEKTENKRVAEATNTGTARRGSSKASDFTLLENARKGAMPESSEDMYRLLELRRKNK